MKIINLEGNIFQKDAFLSYWGVEVRSINLEDVRELIQDINDDITFNLTTEGGSLFEAISIYNEILSWKKNNNKTVTFFINGMVASAGTYLCMAGDNIQVSENSAFMIHNAKATAYGDVKDLKKASEVLSQFENIVISKYQEKTGLNESNIKNLMEEETYFIGKDIIDNGFADEFIDYESDISIDQIHTSITNILNFKKVQNNNILNCLNSFNNHDIINKIDDHDNNNHNNHDNNNHNNHDNKDVKMDLNELKMKHPTLYDEVVNIGVQQTLTNVKAHAEWVKGGADVETVLDNIVNNKPFTVHDSSKYSMQIQQINAGKKIKNDMGETNVIQLPDEQQTINEIINKNGNKSKPFTSLKY